MADSHNKTYAETSPFLHRISSAFFRPCTNEPETYPADPPATESLIGSSPEAMPSPCTMAQLPETPPDRTAGKRLCQETYPSSSPPSLAELPDPCIQVKAHLSEMEKLRHFLSAISKHSKRDLLRLLPAMVECVFTIERLSDPSNSIVYIRGQILEYSEPGFTMSLAEAATLKVYAARYWHQDRVELVFTPPSSPSKNTR